MADRARIQADVDRRRSTRAPVTVRIEYATVDAMFSEFTQNINEGGLFIETEQPLEVDEFVLLQFRLPGCAEPVKVRGRVSWVREGTPSDPPGMGVEFEGLDTDARAQINEVVRRLRVETNL